MYSIYTGDTKLYSIYAGGGDLLLGRGGDGAERLLLLHILHLLLRLLHVLHLL